MDKKDRIIALIDYYCAGSKAKFALKLGVTPQTISTWISRNTFDIDKVFAKCDSISAEWLLTGNGEMLSNNKEKSLDVENDSDSTDVYYTYLLPMSAAGGTLSGFDTVGVGTVDCEKVISPIADIDFAISVYGDSMAPEYPSGSRVLIKKIDPEAFIVWGNVFVLDTVNGIIVKEVQPSSSDGKIVCHSLNPCGKYKDFEVSKVDIRSMYRVLACITAK